MTADCSPITRFIKPWFGYGAGLLAWLGLATATWAQTKPAFLRPFSSSKPLGNYFLVYRNQHLGLLDSTGRLIVPCRFDDIDAFSEGMAEVVLNGKHGYINQRGRLVVPLRYDGARRFRQGEALVVTPAGDVGYIDRHGAALAPFSQVGRPYFKSDKGWTAQPFVTGTRESTGEFYFAASDGYVPQESPAVDRLDKAGLTVVDGGGIYGLVDSLGHVVFPLILEEANKAQFGWQGWIRIKRGGKYGFFDPHRRRVTIPMIYEDAQPSDMARIWVKQNGQWGMLDRQGQCVVAFIYAGVTPYREGRAIVQQGGLFGYVDTTGQLTTPVHFTKVSAYQLGRAKVYQGHRWLTLDRQGHVLDSGLQNDVLWTWVRNGLILVSLLLFGGYLYRYNVSWIG